MGRRTVRRITLWLILGLFILGCGAPVLVTPPPSTFAPGSLEIVIALTAQAAHTQTAIAAPPSGTPTLTPTPTKTITITPTPTATILFLIPSHTNTSVPTGFFADDDGGGSGSGSGSGSTSQDGYVKPTATASQWSCRVLSKSPANGSVIPGGTIFTARWTVQNTGTSAWPKKGVDVVYDSGAQLNTGKPYYDIPSAVGTGGTVAISVEMEAPKLAKEYSMRWSLKVGKTNFCSVRFVFETR